MELERFRMAKIILNEMDELIKHKDELMSKGFIAEDHRLVFVGTRIKEEFLPVGFRDHYIQSIEDRIVELTQKFNNL